MAKILGLDLGTNSIGLALRNTDNGDSIKDQLELFTSIIFKSGVGTAKTGEFSYAAERTKKRSARRLYQSRKYRIWATLELLIKEGYCPLTIEDLDKWRKYDKEKGLKRQYPIHAKEFEQWVRLDFNGDGVADYSSPYQLRAELMEKQFDFSNQTDRYKLGRALYHIAQHRGFKSSKGESISEQKQSEVGEEFDVTELKKSEIKKSGELVKIMQENNLLTVGCALYDLEKRGERIKASKYQAVRSQLKDEIIQIFKFQKGLDENTNLYKRIISDKKGEGTIFYKRPLRSQKGNVGKCTLEPNKPRCPISHPEFEEYRAWSFINNIKYRENENELSLWQTLPLELKQKLFKEKFLRVKTSFKFEEIRTFLEKELGIKLVCNKTTGTINYKDNTSVSACPVSARFKNLLGENYQQWTFESEKCRVNHKTGEQHRIKYNYLDLWHICSTFDEVEYIDGFAKEELGFDDKQTKQLATIWGNIQQGYGSLSLKAIRNINKFLKQGFIYSNAVLLAKLPDIFKTKWEKVEIDVLSDLQKIIDGSKYQKEIFEITNKLIANYKSLDLEERFAEHNREYKLQEQDLKDVEDAVSKHFAGKSKINILQIEKDVKELYQKFFSSSKRDYYHLPKLSESLAEYLIERYSYLNKEDLKKIYHHSMIDIYPTAKETLLEDGRYLKLLDSPVIGALKNPMAMRVLHTLRSQINDLIKQGKIDEQTRIVVETARELNDANMRWAIEQYQRERENLNKEIEKKLKEENITPTDDAVDKVRILVEQQDILDLENDVKKTKNKEDKELYYNKYIKKYLLWKEQEYRCIYTGNIIKLSDLFEENKIDIEHTIPRSISFDDSLSNLTVCYANFNRNVKKKQFPSQLTNHAEILQRIKPWIEKVEHLEERINHWKEESKKATTKDRKDECIRQRHLWEMEYEYWKKKVDAFTIKEVSEGFRNNQLNDTRTITKYAYHYLKTVFNKVDVQKGKITAEFRKIVGVQSVDEKKDRSKHSHHAIDATILTLIPNAEKREKLLKLFYQKEEDETNKALYEAEIKKILKSFVPKDSVIIKDFIESNILVNHISKDQSLTPARRRKRIRGKIVPILDKDGKKILETNEDGSLKRDKYGRPIPKAKQWIKGDSIRGELHKDTFYGAITRNKDFENPIYVVRRELKHKKSEQDTGFKNWEELEKVIVNKDLIKMMKEQFPENTDFKTAVEQGIYMLDKNGNKVNQIRHVRCEVPSVKNPLKIKEQTYKSKKEYKNTYNVVMGDLYAMSRYESEDKKKIEYKVWSLFDISKNRKSIGEDIPQLSNGKTLSHILTRGDLLLIYNTSQQELYSMDNIQLQQRLYVVRGFENDGKRIILTKAINAQQDKDLGKGESVKDFNKMPEKIRQGINGLNYLIKGKDFDLIGGEIVFLNKK